MSEIDGERLLLVRKENNLTQTELGQKVYLSKQVISNIERGVTKTISEPVINLLSYELLVTVDYLKGESDKRNENRDGLIVPIVMMPDWDYDFEIQNLLKIHSENKDIEVLLRGIIYYLSQVDGCNQGENYLGVILLKKTLNILKNEKEIDLELLVKIISSFEEAIDSSKD